MLRTLTGLVLIVQSTIDMVIALHVSQLQLTIHAVLVWMTYKRFFII
jgi:hypothetical protein